MALHARNIAINAGATGDEVDWLARELAAAHDVRIDFAKSLLQKRRGSTSR
jgi:hydroxymethylglutaryl-CoA reductase